jgi:hypothetical protein
LSDSITADCNLKSRGDIPHDIAICLLMSLSHEGSKNLCEISGFQAVTFNAIAFWDVMPCSLVGIHQRFGRPCCLHLHGRRLSEAWKNKNSMDIGRRRTGTRALRTVLLG